MIWAKCGKILTDGNKVINCPSNPCGWYSVFGIKYRYLNQDTMQPSNQCRWYFDVFPSEVKDSRIIWTYMYQVCFQVSQNSGLVAKGKIKQGCWEQCWEWDQNYQNCIDWHEYCDMCIQYQIYNLAGCYDDYNKFAEAFYSACGVSADENGNYPQIFSEWYGTLQPSDSAYNCMDNYWYKRFYDIASVNYNLTINYKQQLWWIYGCYRDGVYTTQYQCNCDGNWTVGEQPCDDGCEQYVYEYLDHETSVGSLVYRQDRSGVEQYFYGGGFWGYSDQCWSKDYPCYVQDCCDRNSARGKVGEAWNFAYSFINDKSAYNNNGTTQHSCTNSDNLCKDFSYKSVAYDNFYGDTDSVRYRFQWATLSLSKNGNTPQWAKGVKFKAQLTRYKRNQGCDRGAEQKIESQEEIIVYFDQEYQTLPFTSYLTPTSYIKKQDCNSDCDSEDWTVQIQPYPIYGWAGNHYPHDNHSDQYNYRFIAVEYVK